MQQVASRSSVHSSQHHGLDPRGRTPASESKQPSTSFSLLLDGTESNEATPPPRPKQHDGATKTNEPSRSSASEPSHADQTQAQSGQDTKATAEADHADAKTADAKTADAKTAEAKTADIKVAATPGDDKTGAADDTDSADKKIDATAAAITAPLPAQQPPATVVPTQADPTDATAGNVDLTKAAAAAGLKADQPSGPKGTADQKGDASSSDDSGQTDAAPAADTTASAAPAGAPKPQGEAHAPAATPADDKPEHGRAHEAAARGEIHGSDELAAPQTTPAADGAPTTKSPDGTQFVTTQQQVDRSSATAAGTAAPATTNATAAVPLAGLAVEIAGRAQSGHNRFDIRLDPPELGRIHVSLDVDKSGHVTSHLLVDRPETLDALRRDAGDLERALQQAGLKTGDNGLQFSLRDQSFAGRDDSFTAASPTGLVEPDSDLAPVETAAASYGRLLRVGGVDIRV